MAYEHIGLIGGLSPTSTEVYYRLICQRYNAQAGGLRFPRLTLRSLDMQQMVDCFKDDRWQDVARHIVLSVHDLAAAGADFVAIAANTPHQVFDRVQRQSELPVLSIMKPTADAIESAGMVRIGLTGTRATMEQGFYQRVLTERGIETLLPTDDERAWLDTIIWKELAHGAASNASQHSFANLMQELSERGAEGIVLACTELSMLVQGINTPMPLFDTASLHVGAIVGRAMTEAD